MQRIFWGAAVNCSLYERWRSFRFKPRISRFPNILPGVDVPSSFLSWGTEINKQHLRVIVRDTGRCPIKRGCSYMCRSYRSQTIWALGCGLAICLNTRHMVGRVLIGSTGQLNGLDRRDIAVSWFRNGLFREIFLVRMRSCMLEALSVQGQTFVRVIFAEAARDGAVLIKVLYQRGAWKY